MSSIPILGPLLSLIFLVAVVYVAMTLTGKVLWLVVNGAVGFALLWLVNLLPLIKIDINIWSILVVVFGGIPGLVLLILLNLIGINL